MRLIIIVRSCQWTSSEVSQSGFYDSPVKAGIPATIENVGKYLQIIVGSLFAANPRRVPGSRSPAPGAPARSASGARRAGPQADAGSWAWCPASASGPARRYSLTAAGRHRLVTCARTWYSPGLRRGIARPQDRRRYFPSFSSLQGFRLYLASRKILTARPRKHRTSAQPGRRLPDPADYRRDRSWQPDNLVPARWNGFSHATAAATTSGSFDRTRRFIFSSRLCPSVGRAGVCSDNALSECVTASLPDSPDPVRRSSSTLPFSMRGKTLRNRSEASLSS